MLQILKSTPALPSDWTPHALSITRFVANPLSTWWLQRAVENVTLVGRGRDSLTLYLSVAVTVAPRPGQGLTQPSGSRVLAEASAAQRPVATPVGVGFPTAWHGAWVLRVSVPKRKDPLGDCHVGCLNLRNHRATSVNEVSHQGLHGFQGRGRGPIAAWRVPGLPGGQGTR